MVWRVREVLAFQADSRAARISCSMGSLNAGKEVTCVELQSRLCSIHFHGSTAHWFNESCSKAHLPFLVFVEYIVMVKATAVLDLLVVSIDVLAEWLGLAEIKWCAFHEADLTCRNRSLVNRQIVICIDLTNDVINRRSWISDAG